MQTSHIFSSVCHQACRNSLGLRNSPGSPRAMVCCPQRKGESARRWGGQEGLWLVPGKGETGRVSLGRRGNFLPFSLGLCVMGIYSALPGKAAASLNILVCTETGSVLGDRYLGFSVLCCNVQLHLHEHSLMTLSPVSRCKCFQIQENSEAGSLSIPPPEP